MTSRHVRSVRAVAKLRNVVHSVVLVLGIGAILGACALVLWGPGGVVWTTVAVIALLLMTPRITPELVMRLYRARQVHPRHGGPLAGILAELARRAELPAVPRLYVIPSLLLNAFATGSRSDSSIAVTQAMLDRLSLRELTGVLAHEVSHIRNNDLWTMTLADSMSRLTRLMSYVGVVLFILNLPLVFAGMNTIPWLAIALLYFAPALSSLLQLALSRAREYDADLEAVRLSDDPEGLASALQRLEHYQGRIWEDMFMPGQRMPQPSVLRTHPPTEERVRRLLALREPPRRRPIALPEALAALAGTAPVTRRPRYHWSGLWY